MFRKELVTKIPDWYYTVQFGVWELHIINSSHGKIGYINEITGTYRIHKDGFWSGRNENEMLKSYIKFYKTMNARFDFKYNKIIKPILSEQYNFLACNYEKAGNVKEAKRSLKK